MSDSSYISSQTDDRELIDLLRLSLIPGVGPKTRKRLLARFGTLAAVLAASPSELREIEGVGPKLLQKIVSEDHRQYDAAAEIVRAKGKASPGLAEEFRQRVLVAHDHQFLQSFVAEVVKAGGVTKFGGAVGDTGRLLNLKTAVASH